MLDIESTLGHVCQRVLGDAAASKEVRHARALGLRELGRIFRATKVLSRKRFLWGSSYGTLKLGSDKNAKGAWAARAWASSSAPPR